MPGMRSPLAAGCGGRRRSRALVAALVLAVGMAAGCGVDMTGDRAGAGDERSTLPAVELRALGGSAAIMSTDITGPAVVNLWATWCAPCRLELPAFQAVHADLGDRVRFIGVNQSEDPARAQAFLDEIGVTYEQLIDPDGDLLASLRVTGLPATVFLAQDGTWVLHSGVLTEDYLRELIGETLGVTA